MKPNKHKSGGAPLPENVLTDKRISVCLCIPDEPEYRQAFLGHLADLGKWWFWDKGGLGDTRATQAAELWRNLIYREMHMPCSENQRIVRQYYNANGHLEVEYENGETEVRDDLDPRYSSPTFYPLPGEDGGDKRCNAAASIADVIQADFIEVMQDGDTSNQLLNLIIALIAVFLTAGAGLPILVMAMVSAIIAFGIAATKSAFTAQVWADFKCILYCNMSDDASFTEAQWNTVKDLINSEFSGSIVATVLWNTVNAAGPVGLTNMARSGRVTGWNCDSCDCSDVWCHYFYFPTDHGEFVRGSSSGVFFGVWESGTGWQAEDTTNVQTGITTAHRQLIINRNWTNATLTRIVITYDFTGGTYDSNSLTAFALTLNGSNVFTVSRAAMVNGTNLTKEWTSPGVVRNSMGIILRSSRDTSAPYTYSGVAVIKSIRIEGTGVNPFGTNNCPPE